MVVYIDNKCNQLEKLVKRHVRCTENLIEHGRVAVCNLHNKYVNRQANIYNWGNLAFKNGPTNAQACNDCAKSCENVCICK